MLRKPRKVTLHDEEVALGVGETISVIILLVCTYLKRTSVHVSDFSSGIAGTGDDGLGFIGASEAERYMPGSEKRDMYSLSSEERAWVNMLL